MTLPTRVIAGGAGAATPCDNAGWQPGEGLRGMDGKIRATIWWDRDGAGGNAPRLVAAGEFTIAGTTFANNIAVWNGNAWEPLGAGTPAGINGEIHSLAVLPDGDLVAGGVFRRAGTLAAERIARWNGTAWAPMGAGFGTANTTIVKALAVLPDGSLVAAGRFTTAGGRPAMNIARWNGTEWSPLGSGIGDNVSLINSLVVTPGGGIVAAGAFGTAGGKPALGVARWNGQDWSQVGDGISGTVHSLVRLPNGDLVAGGGSAAGGGSGTRVLRWDGISWSGMSAGIAAGSASVLSLQVLRDGTLVAGGSFATEGQALGGANIAAWNGAFWESPGGGAPGMVLSVSDLPSGEIVAAGDFLKAGEVHASNIARWNGRRWNFFGTGFGGVSRNYIYTLLRLPNGDVIAGGAFRGAGAVEANNIARWNGSTWAPMGSGLDGDVRALVRMPNGDVVAGGQFFNAGGTPARGVARWNGSRWFAVGTDVGTSPPAVFSLAVLKNGDLVACGPFGSLGGVTASGIARWNGESWLPFGSGVLGSPSALAVMANGDLVVGGEITRVDGIPVNKIARWDGVKWSAMGAGVNGGVHALHPLPNGDLLAGGRFGTAGGVAASRIARWDGTAWSALGTGLSPIGTPEVHAIASLANGDIVIGGRFSRAGSVATDNLARWNGSEWTALGTGTGGAFDSRVHAFAALPDGGFVMGGGFAAVDGRPHATFARWGCPSGPDQPKFSNVSMGGEGLRFQFEGVPGRTYGIQYTRDLVKWELIRNELSGTVVFEETESARRTAAEGFYKVTEMPPQ